MNYVLLHNSFYMVDTKGLDYL